LESITEDPPRKEVKKRKREGFAALDYIEETFEAFLVRGADIRRYLF